MDPSPCSDIPGAWEGLQSVVAELLAYTVDAHVRQAIYVYEYNYALRGMTWKTYPQITVYTCAGINAHASVCSYL